MTSLQEDPSAQAPCTSTTLRASTGARACEKAGAARNSAESRPKVMSIDLRSAYIAVSEIEGLAYLGQPAQSRSRATTPEPPRAPRATGRAPRQRRRHTPDPPSRSGRSAAAE